MSSKTSDTKVENLDANEGPSMEARRRVLEQRKAAAKKKQQRRSGATMRGGSIGMSSGAMSMGGVARGGLMGGSAPGFSPMTSGFSSPMASKARPSSGGEARPSRFGDESRSTEVDTKLDESSASGGSSSRREEGGETRRSARDSVTATELEEEELADSSRGRDLRVRTAKSPQRRAARDSSREREERRRARDRDEREAEREEEDRRRARDERERDERRRDERRRDESASPSSGRRYDSDEDAEEAQEQANSPIGVAEASGRPRVVSRSSAGTGGADANAHSVAPDLSDMRRFLTTPIKKENGVVQCYIERRRKGPITRQFPEYSLHLKDGREFLLVAKKKPGNKTSNYHISMDKKKGHGVRSLACLHTVGVAPPLSCLGAAWRTHPHTHLRSSRRFLPPCSSF